MTLHHYLLRYLRRRLLRLLWTVFFLSDIKVTLCYPNIINQRTIRAIFVVVSGISWYLALCIITVYIRYIYPFYITWSTFWVFSRNRDCNCSFAFWWCKSCLQCSRMWYLLPDYFIILGENAIRLFNDCFGITHMTKYPGRRTRTSFFFKVIICLFYNYVKS